jgi:hypothetical protein
MLRADTQTWMLGRIYEISSAIPQEIREGRREAREDAREIRRILRSQDRRLARMESKGGSDALKIEKWILVDTAKPHDRHSSPDVDADGGRQDRRRLTQSTLEITRRILTWETPTHRNFTLVIVGTLAFLAVRYGV